jgi:YHS domain-containing protein
VRRISIHQERRVCFAEPPYGPRRIGMEKDVVCGMQVDPAKAAATSEYQGKTYYFCAKICKTKFDADPAKYVGR